MTRMPTGLTLGSIRWQDGLGGAVLLPWPFSWSAVRLAPLLWADRAQDTGELRRRSVDRLADLRGCDNLSGVLGLEDGVE